MADIDLTTLDAVKRELGPTSLTTNVDPLLSAIITAASRVIMTQTGRRFWLQTQTKTFHGDATYGLALPNGPVRQVQQVQIDGNFIPQIISPGDSGWTLLYDRLELVGYTFTTGISNVVVSYTTGWETIPEDIERACIEFSCWIYQNRNHIGIQQRSVHDAEAVTFRKDEWPFIVQLTIEAYKTFMGIAPFGGVEEPADL